MAVCHRRAIPIAAEVETPPPGHERSPRNTAKYSKAARTFRQWPRTVTKLAGAPCRDPSPSSEKFRGTRATIREWRGGTLTRGVVGPRCVMKLSDGALGCLDSSPNCKRRWNSMVAAANCSLTPSRAHTVVKFSAMGKREGVLGSYTTLVRRGITTPSLHGGLTGSRPRLRGLRPSCYGKEIDLTSRSHTQWNRTSGPRNSAWNPELTRAGGRGIGPRDLGKVGRKQRNRPMEWFGGNSLFFLLSSLFLIHLNLNF